MDWWMDGWMDWMDGWMDQWINWWIDEQLDGKMGGCPDRWVSVQKGVMTFFRWSYHVIIVKKTYPTEPYDHQLTFPETGIHCLPNHTNSASMPPIYFQAMSASSRRGQSVSMHAGHKEKDVHTDAAKSPVSPWQMAAALPWKSIGWAWQPWHCAMTHGCHPRSSVSRLGWRV
jgi:hypothetical protein